MTCRELTDFILDYLSGELAPPTRATFEEHLAVCEDCVRYLDNYQQAVALGSRAFDDSSVVPPDVPERLIQAILAARRSSA